VAIIPSVPDPTATEEALKTLNIREEIYAQQTVAWRLGEGAFERVEFVGVEACHRTRLIARHELACIETPSMHVCDSTTSNSEASAKQRSQFKM